MAIWEATVTVTFSGRVEADTQHEAEQLAMESWADDHSAALTYEGVEDVGVEEVELCTECGLELWSECECEDGGSN